MAVETDSDGRVLSLPFQADEVSYVRMRQADIARLFGVSPARVSQWVSEGKVTAYADGRIDPARAAQELVKNCEVNRLRARPFRPLRKELDVARKQMAAVAAERDESAARVEALRDGARVLLRRYLEAELWLTGFYERALESTWGSAQDEFDAAGEGAMNASPATLGERIDPDILALARGLGLDVPPPAPEPNASDVSPASPLTVDDLEVLRAIEDIDIDIERALAEIDDRG